MLFSAMLFAGTWGAGSDLSRDRWDPEQWQPYAQRPALMPEMAIDTEKKLLVSRSTGAFHINGAWRRSIPVEANQVYRIRALYRSDDVPLRRRSVLVQMEWLDDSGRTLGVPEFPVEAGPDEEGWQRIESRFRAPAGAAAARVDLIFRWSENGSVSWRGVSLEPADLPEPREVVIATVHFRPSGTPGPEENLRLFEPLVRQAGEQGADVVLLPEGVTLVGTGKNYIQVAEPVPGPSTETLGRMAREFSMYIVAGLLEQDGETVYNTAVLIDREGTLAGRYRKVSLPREEIDGGITPGNAFPVFETDFGTVGMMICWDMQFVEPARALTAAGAEIILVPIWGGIEPVYPARAIENSVYLVTSSYDSRTGIWNPSGELVAEAPQDGSIALYRANLEERTLWEWIGDFRSRLPREAPPVEN